MSHSLTIDLADATAAGRALASVSDDAAGPGSAFLAAAAAVTGPVAAGASIGSSVQSTGDAIGAACAEMASSALGLGGLIQDAAAALAATENAAIRRYGTLTANW